MPFCNLEQHFPAGGIEGNFAVVAAAEGLARVGQVEAQRFQCLFLLGCHLTVLVLAVEHMALVDVGCAFVQMQCPVQHMDVFAKLCLELLDELGDDVQQVLCRSVFIQRSKLVDGLFRAGLAAGQQDLGVALVLAFDEGRVVGLVELPFYIREGRRQIVRVLWSESRTETVKAVPVDVALGSFRVDVLTVSKVETAWGYRCRGFRLVRCVVLISDRHPSFPVFLCTATHALMLLDHKSNTILPSKGSCISRSSLEISSLGIER